MSDNPLYRHLVEFDVIERVYQHTESVAEPRLQREAEALRHIYQRIRTSFLTGVSSTESSPGKQAFPNPSEFPSEQLVAFSAPVIQDSVQFVSASIEYYRNLSACRPLTAEEKQLGASLITLLTKIQGLLPGRDEQEVSEGDEMNRQGGVPERAVQARGGEPS
jgi:hypothetical protein